MKSNIRTVLMLLGIIVLLNFKPRSKQDINYATLNGAFTFEEMNFQGRDYSMCLRRFADYKAAYPTDTQLYRLTPVEYWKVWNWLVYLRDPRYDLPYHPQAKALRRRDISGSRTAYQDF